MKTLFRKLIVPLVFLMSALAATSASATLYKVTDYAVYKFSGGGDIGYVKVTGADCVGFNCYFQLNVLGTSMVMALATAKQMQIGIYLHGNSGDGSGIYSLADSGRLVQGVELFRDPATFGTVSQDMPISIYADESTTGFYRTCAPAGFYGCRSGGFPGYTRGWRYQQLITTDAWFNAYGSAYPVAALSTLYNAFSNQFGVIITMDGAQIASIYSYAKCGTWSGQCM